MPDDKDSNEAFDFWLDRLLEKGGLTRKEFSDTEISNMRSAFEAGQDSAVPELQPLSGATPRTVTRYDSETGDERPDGDVVLYEDYAELERELAEAKKKSG